MEDDQHGAGRPGKYQPGVWPPREGAEPRCSLAEDDDNFRPGTDEEGQYWMDAGNVGIRERETGVCRQKPLGGGRREKVSRRAMFAGEWRLHVAFASGR